MEPSCWTRLRDKKLVTVEPVIFLYMFSTFLQLFVTPLYIINQYQAEALIQAVLKNSSDAHCRDLAYHNRSFVCISNDDLTNCSNNSGSGDSVEERSNTLILVTNVAGQIPSVLVALVCGPMSDRVGRRPMMLALSISGALSAGIILLVMYLRLDIHFFVLVYFVNSLGGGTPVLFTSTFSYIADFSSARWMTYRIGFAEGILVLSIAASTAVGGAWIKNSDCYFPNLAWLMLAGYLAIAIYVLLFLPESLSREERLRRRMLAGNPPGCRSILRGLEIVFMPGHSRWRLWIFLYVLGIIYLVASGLNTVNTLYFTHPPLQWGSELIGLYNTVFFMMHGVALVFVLPILVAVKLHDSIISFAGMTFSAAMAILNIFARSTWQMFTIGSLVGFEAIAAPAMRSMMSKSVNPNDQGAIFSVVAAVQSICSLIAIVTLSLMYGHILKAGWPAGTVFSLTAFFAASTLPFLITLFVCRNKKGEKYEPPEVVIEEKRGLLNDDTIQS